MKLNSTTRWVLVALAAGFLLVVGGFGLARAAAGDGVLGHVEALGVDLKGLSPDEVRSELATASDTLMARQPVFSVSGATTSIEPSQVGLAIDVESMAEEALQVGRTGGLSSQFRWWLGHFGNTEHIPTLASTDPDKLEKVLAVWDQDLVGDPPFPGSIIVDGTAVTPSYPRPGKQIDRDVAPALILDALTADQAGTVTLPVVTATPKLTDTAVDAAVAQAKLLLSAPVTLTSESGDKTITFPVRVMAGALRTTPKGTQLELYFDPDAIAPALDAARSDLEQPPVDAQFQIADNGVDVVLVPGHPGTVIDPAATAANLIEAAGRATRSGVLPFVDGAEPGVTTTDLEKLGIRHLVSQFTTYHDCCQNRVTNIHLIADKVDGVIIAPGETFSLNEFVGPRTEADGFLEDGTIVGGELTKTVGGGVSQFATTFYNAVFWGGYEDVTHKPHSFYFSRYPEGIEATISWPSPDLQFKNDSKAGILVKTSYTDTSITVRFYGENDGRAVALSYPVGGPLDIEVLAEGGPQARIVGYSVSDRFAPTEATKPLYRPNPELDVEEQKQVQSPAGGWSVKVTRTITVAGDETTQTWTVTYSPRQEIIEVHPCMMPDATVACPEPSTTTTSSTTPDATTPDTTPTTVSG